MNFNVPNIDADSPATTKPTGNRATWKVRRVARKYAKDLGRLRHVESSRTGKWQLVFWGGFWASLTLAMLLGSAPSLIAAVLIAVVAGIAMWMMGHQKLLIFDRGIVVGNFLVGLRPMVLLFHSIDATTIRTSYGYSWLKGQPKLIADFNGADPDYARNGCPWSGWDLTFTGPDADAVRGVTGMRRARRTAPLAAGQAPLDTIWTLGAVTRPRLERALHALADAMIDANVPGADQITTQALPPRHITGTAADAHYLAIPHHQRNPYLTNTPAPRAWF